MCWLSVVIMAHFVIPLLFRKVKTSAFLADGIGENKTTSMFLNMTVLHPVLSLKSKLFSCKTIC